MNILDYINLSWILVTFIVILTPIAWMNIYFKWTSGVFKRLGIPGPESGPMGILPDLGMKGIVGFDPEMMRKYGRVVGAFHGRRPTLFVSDPEMIREIFVKDFNSYPNRSSLLPADDMLKMSLPNIQNVDHWRFTRSVLSPAFTSGKLREMVPLIQRCIDSLIWNFDGSLKTDGVVDAKSLFSAYTMDVIASTGFGMEVDSQNDPMNPFVQHAKKAVNFSFKSNILKYSRLTEDEIVANSLFFLLAGFDTTSITLTFVLYNLAVHQVHQDRLYQDIRDIIGQEKPSYDNVMGLEYLDMVVQETLRMYPPATRLNRRTSRAVNLKGYKIPKDMMIFVPIWHIHRDPEFWPDPDTFDPERFNSLNKNAFNPYCFLPFGAGPRNCLGTRLAMLEIKMAVVALLQKFKIMTTPDTEIPPTLEKGGFVRAQNPVKLRVELR